MRTTDYSDHTDKLELRRLVRVIYATRVMSTLRAVKTMRWCKSRTGSVHSQITLVFRLQTLGLGPSDRLKGELQLAWKSRRVLQR